MGAVQHRSIMITNCVMRDLKKARKQAVKLFGKDLVTPITGTGMNGYMSFAVVSCGSQAWWPEDDKHIENINKFVEHLDSYQYGDGSTCMNYVHMEYGGCGLQVVDNTGKSYDSNEGDSNERVKKTKQRDVRTKT